VSPRHLATSGAGAGDDEAYRLLVEPLRPELQAHCRRMLGSPHDAEDAVQETLLRAWHGLPRFEGRSSVRSWLFRVATNACLDALAGRRRRPPPWHHATIADLGALCPEPARREPAPGGRPAGEEARLAPEAGYERRESCGLAFIAVIRHLPSRQRAVLILRDVLGFSARETAAALGTTATSVNSALQRARAALAAYPAPQSRRLPPRALGDRRLHGIVERCLDALEEGDAAGIVTLLVEDADACALPVSRTRTHAG
jgi:RNA polymerase sigma-70 factor (ECF subfamily)